MLSHSGKGDKGQHLKGAPAVINEILIKQQIKEYNEENKIWDQNDIPFSKVRDLFLSFKNLQVISNLQGFDKLQKLKLDNNNIEDIDGISHLTTLTWLDLSFNNIKVITGLECLVNLTDLSLFHNQIEDIFGLPTTLKKLDILSIGCNKFKSIDQIVQHLRRFQKLQCLNIAGCPQIEATPEYEKQLIGPLSQKEPKIKYINYTFIDEERREKVLEEWRAGAQGTFEPQLEGESEEELAKAAKKEQDLKKAMVFTLNNFTSDIRKEQSLQKLLENLPGVPEIIQNQLEDARDETSVYGIVKNIQIEVVKVNGSKIKIKDMFGEAMEERFLEAEALTIKMLEKFSERKEELFNTMESPLTPRNIKDLKNLEKDVEKLNGQLLQIELDMYQSIDDQFNNVFVPDLKSIYKQIIEIGKEEFDKINDKLQELVTLVEQTKEKWMNLCQQAAENEDLKSDGDEDENEYEQDDEDNKYEDDEDVGGISNALMEWMEDEDEVNNLVNNLQDQVQQISTRYQADIFTKRLKNDEKTITTTFQDALYKRNRQNINNIIHELSKCRIEIQKQFEKGEEDSDEDDA